MDSWQSVCHLHAVRWTRGHNSKIIKAELCPFCMSLSWILFFQSMKFHPNGMNITRDIAELNNVSSTWKKGHNSWTISAELWFFSRYYNCIILFLPMKFHIDSTIETGVIWNWNYDIKMGFLIYRRTCYFLNWPLCQIIQ